MKRKKKVKATLMEKCLHPERFYASPNSSMNPNSSTSSKELTCLKLLKSLFIFRIYERILIYFQNLTKSKEY